MSIFWSPTAPARQVPGGTYWWAQRFANILTSLQQPKASLNAFVGDLATLGVTVGQLAANLTGVMEPSGVLAPSLQKLAPALNGAQIESGSLATSLQCPGASLNAQEIEQGVLSAALPGTLTVGMTGAQAQVGAISVAIQQLSAAITGVEQPNGVLAATLQLATAAITGGQMQTGTFVVSLQQAAATLTAAEIESGSLAASLFKALAQLAGTSVAAAVPVFDAQSTAVVGSGVSTISISLTIGVNATVYVVFSTNSSVTVSSVKTGTTNGVLVSSQAMNNVTTNGTLYVYKFTGLAAGTYTFIPTTSSTTRLSGFAFSFTGVNTEVVATKQFASTTAMNVGPDTLRASAIGLALFAVGSSSTTGTINAPTGGTALPKAQQASNISGCTGEYSATTGTTFAFGNSASAPEAGILLYVDAVAPPTPTINTTTAGTSTATVPAGGTVDLIALGAGGAGSFGSLNNGNPGAAGGWALATGLKVGTDILAGSTITATVGAGGVGTSTSNGNGGAGGNTTISYYDMSSVLHTITGTGGAGGTGSDGSGSTSPGLRPSPVSQFVTEVTYTSGTAATGGAHPAGDGLPPGASGAGMTSTSGTSPYGANGGAWVTFS